MFCDFLFFSRFAHAAGPVQVDSSILSAEVKVHVRMLCSCYGFGRLGGGADHFLYGINEKLISYIVDSDKNELVWQGIGKGYIYTDKPEKKSEKISAMVGKILLQFPPSKN